MHLHRHLKSLLFVALQLPFLGSSVVCYAEEIDDSLASPTQRTVEFPTRQTRAERNSAEAEILRTKMEAMSESDIDDGMLEAILIGQSHLVPLYAEHLDSIDGLLDEVHTPLSLACEQGFPEIVQILLDLDADPNGLAELDHSRISPLSIALQHESFHCAVKLLEAGAGLRTGSADTMPVVRLEQLGIAVDEADRDAIIKSLNDQRIDPEKVSKSWTSHVSAEAENSFIHQALEQDDIRWNSRYEAATTAILESPPSPEAWMDLAECFEEWRAYDQVIACADEALALDEDNLEALNFKANALRRMKRFAAALELLNKVDELSPRHARAAYLRAMILKSNGKYPSALAVINESLRHHPTDARLLNGKAILLLGRREFESAGDLLATAIETDPMYKYLYYNLAKVQNARGDSDGAIESLTRARSIDPLYTSAYLRRGYYRGSGNAKRQDYFRAIRVASLPSDASVPWSNLAFEEAEEGNLWKAVNYATKSIEADPANKMGYQARAGTLRLAKMGSNALDDDAMVEALAFMSQMTKEGIASSFDETVARNNAIWTTLDDVNAAAIGGDGTTLTYDQLTASGRQLGRLALLMTIVDHRKPVFHRIYSMRALLAFGIDPNGPITTDGNTLLHYAADQCRSAAELHFLLRAGADITAKNAAGETPAEIFLPRVIAGEFATSLLDDAKENTEVKPGLLPLLAEIALREEFEARLLEIDSLATDFTKEQREQRIKNAKAEERIRDLEIMAAASAAAGYDDSRQMRLEMNQMHERVEREREDRQAFQAPSAVKSKAFSILKELNYLTNAICRPGSDEFLVNVVSIQETLKWGPLNMIRAPSSKTFGSPRLVVGVSLLAGFSAVAWTNAISVTADDATGKIKQPDAVEVISAQAPLMDGKVVRASVAKGACLKVTKTQGGWYLVAIPDGKGSAWIHQRHVQPLRSSSARRILQGSLDSPPRIATTPGTGDDDQGGTAASYQVEPIGDLPKPYNFQHRVSDISQDGRLAVIVRDNIGIDVVDITSGKTLSNLPPRLDHLGKARAVNVKLDDDQRSLWAGPGNLDRLLGSVTLSDEDILESAPEYQEPTRQESIRAAKTVARSGIGLAQIDLATGEVVGELKMPNRIIIAFAKCSIGSQSLMATLSVELNGRIRKKTLLSVIGLPSHEILSELPIDDFRPKSLRPRDLLFVMNQDGSILFSGRSRPSQLLSHFRFVDRELVEVEKAAGSMVPEALDYKALRVHEGVTYVYCEGPGKHQHRYGRLFRIAADGRLTEWLIDDVGRFVVDSSRLRLSVSESGLVAIGGLFKSFDASDYSTVLLDTQTGKSKWLQDVIIEGFGPDETLISNEGTVEIRDARSVFHPWAKAERNGTLTILNSASKGHVLASSPEQCLVLVDGHFEMRNRASGESATTFAINTFNNADEQTYDIDRATACFDSENDTFLVAIPRKHADPAGLSERIRQNMNGGDRMSGYSVTPAKMNRVVRYTQGVDWDVYRVGAETSEPTIVQTVDNAVWCNIATIKGNVGIAWLGHLHREAGIVVCTTNGVEIDRYTQVNEKAPQYVAWAFEHWLSWLADYLNPSLRMRLCTRGDTFLFICAASLHNGSFDVPVILFDSVGKQITTKQVHRVTHPFFHIESDKTEATSATVMFWLQSDPYAIDYARDIDSVVLVGTRPESTTISKDLSAFASSSSQDRNGYGLRVESYPTDDQIDFDIRRYTEARAIFTGIPRNFDNRLPDTPALLRFEVDDSGSLAWCEYSVTEGAVNLVHIPSVTKVAQFNQPIGFPMTDDGQLLLPSGAVGDWQTLGASGAFVSESADPASEPTSSPAESISQTYGAQRRSSYTYRREHDSCLYFLGVAGSQFVDNRFSGLQYCDDDIVALHDAAHERAKSDAMDFRSWVLAAPSVQSITVEERLAELVSLAKPEDTVVLALASHGVRLQRGLYLIVPQSRLESPQGSAVSWTLIANAIDKLKAQRVIVLLDTCHAGSFSEDSTALLNETQERLRKRSGLTVLAASSAAEQALELPQYHHGAFTYGLLQAMDGKEFPLQFSDDQISQTVCQQR